MSIVAEGRLDMNQFSTETALNKLHLQIKLMRANANVSFSEQCIAGYAVFKSKVSFTRFFFVYTLLFEEYSPETCVYLVINLVHIVLDDSGQCVY